LLKIGMGEPDTALGLRQASVLTGGGVLVLRLDVEGPPQKELPGVDSDPLGPLKEPRGNENPDAILLERRMA
jgi:hypothetical protein